MKYFRLHLFCKYVSGKENGCIYNMHTNEMIAISEKNKRILDRVENNQPVKREDTSYLQKLVEMGMGFFYDKPPYIEHMRRGQNPIMKSIIYPNAFVKRAYIQLTNDCELECCFCNKNGGVNRRTGCKKWENFDAKITQDEWEKILIDLKKIGCEQLIFIGGNPLLESKKLLEIMELAKSIRIEKFVVYSHEILLSDKIVEYFIKNNVVLVHTLISFKNETLQKVTRKKIDGEQRKKRIFYLKNKGLEIIPSIVVGRFNENEIDEMTQEFSANNMPWIYNLIYDKPDNLYYSELYKDMMYDKTRDFGLVTKESLQFLEEYNSCLYGQLYINLSGQITPCPMMSHPVIGDIRKKDGMIRAVNSEEYQNLIRMNRDNIEKCGDCAFRYNCLDCRAIESMATGRINGQAYCNYNARVKSSKCRSCLHDKAYELGTRQT